MGAVAVDQPARQVGASAISAVDLRRGRRGRRADRRSWPASGRRSAARRRRRVSSPARAERPLGLPVTADRCPRLAAPASARARGTAAPCRGPRAPTSSQRLVGAGRGLGHPPAFRGQRVGRVGEGAADAPPGSAAARATRTARRDARRERRRGCSRRAGAPSRRRRTSSGWSVSRTPRERLAELAQDAPPGRAGSAPRTLDRDPRGLDRPFTRPSDGQADRARPAGRRPGTGPGRRWRSWCGPHGGWHDRGLGRRRDLARQRAALDRRPRPRRRREQDGVANASTRWVRPLRSRERQSSSSTES